MSSALQVFLLGGAIQYGDYGCPSPQDHQLRDGRECKKMAGKKPAVEVVMDLDPPTRKRELEESGVPPPPSPARRGEQDQLTMEGIGRLLAQQTAELHKQTAELQRVQKEELANAVGGSDKRTLGAIRDLKEEINKEMAHTQKEIEGVKKEQLESRKSQQALAERVAFLENKALTGGSTTASESGARRPALVFGGWLNTATRARVLGDVSDIIKKVGAEDLMDESPWCPGPRKGVALATFACRSGEGPQELRARMNQVVTKVNQAAVSTAHTIEQRPVWATFSRDRADQGQGSHVSKMRRVLHELQIPISCCESDYKEGTLYIGEEVVGSATRAKPHEEGLERGKLAGAWFSPSAMARATGKDVEDIRKVWLRALGAS